MALSSVPIARIEGNTDLSNKVVKLKVGLVFPLSIDEYREAFLRIDTKDVREDNVFLSSSGPDEISIFFRRDFALAMHKIEVAPGDVLICKSLSVVPNPEEMRSKREHSCALVVDGQGVEVILERGAHCVAILTFATLPAILQEEEVVVERRGMGVKRPATTSRPAPPKIIRAEREISYTLLGDLLIQEGQYTYGVVSKVKPPRSTRGSDKVMVLTLVDESLSLGLGVNLFHHDLQWFPEVRPGHIVRMHRVKIQNYNDDKQGINRPRRGFAYVAMDPAQPSAEFPARILKTSEDHVPKMGPVDRERVLALTQWYQQLQSHGSEQSSFEVTLEKAPQHISYCDLVVQLLAIERERILVWDGTGNGCNLTAPWYNGLVPVERKRFGTMGVVVLSQHAQEQVRSVHLRSWVVLESVQVNQQQDPNVLVFSSDGVRASLQPLGSNDPRILQRLQLYRKRLDAQSVASTAPQPLSRAVPVNVIISERAKSLSTHSIRSMQENARSILAERVQSWHEEEETQVPSSAPFHQMQLAKKLVGVFHLKVRVIDYSPKTMDLIARSLCTACGRCMMDSNVCREGCVQGSAPKHVFRFQLRIEDEQGERMDVLVCDEDSRYFFGDLEPCDLETNKDTARAMEERLKGLCSSKDIRDLVVKRYVPQIPTESSYCKAFVMHRLCETQLQVE